MKALELVARSKGYNTYKPLPSPRDLNGEDYSIPNRVDLDVKALHWQYARSHKGRDNTKRSFGKSSLLYLWGALREKEIDVFSRTGNLMWHN
jgi:hypothetical protein